MSGGGKGDNRRNRRRPFRRRDREQAQAFSPDKFTAPEARHGPDIAKVKNMGRHERLQWTPPQIPSQPIPVLDCLYCGKPIKELALAVSDKHSGKAIHFDCIISHISQSERLVPGDTVTYLGGGRFGIVHFDNPANSHVFKIKKTFELEIKENRAEWRQIISDHFSAT